jgi:hypothetical protein
MDIAVQDYEIIPPTKIAKRVKFNVTVELNKRAIVKVMFYPSLDQYDMNLLDEKMVIIEGEEYTAWGNDDAYLETLVFSKLGIQKNVIVEDNTQQKENAEIDNANAETV